MALNLLPIPNPGQDPNMRTTWENFKRLAIFFNFGGSSVLPPVPITIPQWYQISLTYIQFQTAALTNTINLVALLGGVQIDGGIKVWCGTRFIGTGITQVQASCGDPSAVDALTPAFDIGVAVSNSNIQLVPVSSAYDQSATTQLTITLTADANLNNLTAGALTVWVKLSRCV